MPEASNTTSSSQDLKTAIVGRWDTSYVLISMKSINNSDVDGTMEVQPTRREIAVTPQKCTLFFVKTELIYQNIVTRIKARNQKRRKMVDPGKTLILNQEFRKSKPCVMKQLLIKTRGVPVNRRLWSRWPGRWSDVFPDTQEWLLIVFCRIPISLIPTTQQGAMNC